MTGFNRLVEVGRLVYIANGPSAGEPAVIVEIVDHKRVLIDSPSEKVPRQVISLANANLLSIVIPKFPRGARTGIVKKKWETAGIGEKWEQSPTAIKLKAREKKQSLSDFDRFVVMRIRKQRRALVQRAAAKIK